MSFDDWVLALHVLSAVAFAAALVVFWVLIVALRGNDTAEGTLRLGAPLMVGNVAVWIGMAGTMVFGVWLSLSFGDYDLWDGWIVAAIVLWAIGAFLGERAGKEYLGALKKAEALQAAGQQGPNAELLAMNRTSRGLALHTVSSLAFVLILILMIWRPGA